MFVGALGAAVLLDLVGAGAVGELTRVAVALRIGVALAHGSRAAFGLVAPTPHTTTPRVNARRDANNNARRHRLTRRDPSKGVAARSTRPSSQGIHATPFDTPSVWRFDASHIDVECVYLTAPADVAFVAHADRATQRPQTV